MPDYVIPPRPPVSVPTTDGQLFPVRRIYLIGRNYADHVREMGGDPKKDPPVFFGKPPDSVIVPTADNPFVPYAPATADFHYEAEIVLALKSGGTALTEREAEELVWGTAVGCDLTRRDLQRSAKDAGAPWDMAKGFDDSAVLGRLQKGAALTEEMQLSLSLNGETRQHTTIEDMIWSPAEILSGLSKLARLEPGDLIFTGTPDGVGPLSRGDKVEISATGLPTLNFTISDE